jgi:serine/threonine-protein kinase mTOR
MLDYQTRPEDGGADTEKVAINASTTTPPNPSGSGSDDHFQNVVINALLAILRDPSLSAQHYTVIEAIMHIFKSQGLKCVAFLPQASDFLSKPGVV